MVIIVRKEIRNIVRADKSAFFIKRYGQRAVTCSNLQNRIFICIFTCKEVNQCFPISHSMIFRINRNILDFKYSVTFIGDNTFSFYIIIFKYIHSTFFKITVNHILLFIS